MSTVPAGRGIPGFDPEKTTVVRRDDHLQPLSAGALQAAWVRQRIQSAAQWRPVIQGDAARLDLKPERPPAQAAVLLPLVVRDGQVSSVVLTRRTSHLKHHAGQISFPGGKREPDDASSIATALREAKEEVGLMPQQVDVLGTMPAYKTVTGFVITPVVALLPPDLPWQPDPGEVAEVFEVPLSHLMNPSHHQWHEHEWQGHKRQYLSMPWHDAADQRYFIWGATASMLRNFYHLLADAQPA
ncbi:CoA pyrophosphatase [Ideonella paludis]|uniref:CoA pyrophosphatase n=1 Tax=Ideonella paludis TaxID=1233411 RepID=A0ABS5E0J7_9BURK|nr:CoA pyrophosphatase [Ideonella paludis]MBQ0936916.1 CoA pyrophosphatase [Ideonella paludis]